MPIVINLPYAVTRDQVAEALQVLGIDINDLVVASVRMEREAVYVDVWVEDDQGRRWPVKHTMTMPIMEGLRPEGCVRDHDGELVLTPEL